MKRKALRLLLAEDLDDDTALLLDELKRQGYDVRSTCVMSADAFRVALEKGNFEIILCDYTMLGFDALAALDLLRQSGRDIPLIVVSRTIGEEAAVDAMRHGAADYLLRGNLVRLGAAVERAVGLATERRMAAEKLRASEILQRIASNVAHIGGWTVDFPGSRITWSDEVCAIHEMPQGTVPNLEQAISFYAPEWRSRIAAVFEKCLSEGVPFDEEMELITAGKRRIWVRTMGEGIRAESGVTTRIQGAFQDITEKKQAKAAAERLAERMTTTLESITDAFYTVDREWRFTYLNGQATESLRRNREDLIGKVLWEEFPDLEASGFGREYRRAVAENRPVELVDFYPALACWFEVRAYPSAEGLAVHFYDVTERRQSQEHLRILENCVSRITDIVVITEALPLSVVDDGPRILFVNDAFVRHTGYSREEALGKSPRFLQGPKTQLDRLQLIRTALEQGEPVRTELINYTKCGTEIWLEIDIVPVMDDEGVATHLVAVERDITRRKSQEEAARANELRYLVQRNALISLTKMISPDGSDMASAFQRITETSARTLEVGRVSIWRFSEDRSAIECIDLYELASGEHSAGVVLHAADHPAYFEKITSMELAEADDAHANPSTREFVETYLTPLGIVSMMDVPVHFKNRVDYVLCNEHLGLPRQWQADEKTFSVAIANLISLALEGAQRALAQQEAFRSHQRFQSVAAATNDTIWDWNLETDAFWWNDGFAKLFGWAPVHSEATIQVWIRQIHPDDQSRVVRDIYAAIERGDTHWTAEYRFISNDGRTAHVLDRGQVIRDAAGKAIQMVGGMTDLTANKAAEAELGRSHRALQMLSSCNEMLVRTSDEKELLGEACRLAVEIGGYRMAWVGYAMDDEERRITPMSHAGEELGYLSEVKITWAEGHSLGIGPAGRAIRSGEPIIFGDILDNPAFLYWLAPARSRGYRSVICLPLRDERRVFGVLSLYGSEPHPAGPEEIKLLQDMANDLAFGIGNIRSRKESQRTQEVVIKVAQAVSSATGSEFFDLLTRNMVEALGAQGGLIGRYHGDVNSIETISYILQGKLMDSVSYGLDGTPCEQVSRGDTCIFEQGVQGLFPEDHLLEELGIEAYAGIPLFRQTGSVAGIMVVFFSSALTETALVQSTLQIFAVRAAAELDRQQADARIREQASLLDKAQDAILVRDLDHTITFWNKSAERLYGWTSEEALGRSVEDLLYRDTSAFNLAHQQTLNFGEWLGEMNQIDKYGRELTIEGRWTLVRDKNGRPESVFVINTDISEHRRLEEQFLRAQRLESIGTLAGGIAHDLNNILAPISMAIELLKMGVTDGRSAELLDTIGISAKRGADMVGQVLSFARGMEGRRVDVHPRQLILEIETILRDTLLQKIQLEIRAPRDLWTVHGDPTQLHQVLLNLCVNARDAISSGGKISISADNVMIDHTFAAMNLEAHEGPHVCIRVQDDGEGISPEIIDKIFDPFFTTKSVGKGTGLGLSTSLAIVKSHGGFIRTVSKPHEGTRFRVYLPAHPELDSPVAPDIRPDLPSGCGEMVLIVDDEASIRQIAQQTLEAFGYRTLLAANGEEAVSIYSLHHAEVSLVLTDMMMPEMDGSVTIERLMKINPAVRIIATSGIAANRALAELAGAGVKDFLQKPYTAETLLKCLSHVLTIP
jgi:PAS domain S-box-containing protein